MRTRRRIAGLAVVAGFCMGAVACGGGGGGGGGGGTGDSIDDVSAETRAKIDQNIEESLASLGGEVDRSQLECLRDELISALGAEEIERAMADPDNYVPPENLDQRNLLDGCGIAPVEAPDMSELDQSDMDQIPTTLPVPEVVVP
jgi:hypothetical protein